MTHFEFTADNIAKSYTGKIFIFKNFSFLLQPGEVIAVTGENGSGKSTLLKTIAGIINPSRGKITLKINDEVINQDEHNLHLGFVAPYLNLYEEFTPKEHFEIYSKFKGLKSDERRFAELMEQFNIQKHTNKEIRNFSSGMKQRMKYVLSLIGNPEVLMFDEPTSNLDNAGIEIIGNMIKAKSEEGCGIIIATNEDREKRLCSTFYDLKDYQ